MGSLYGHRLQLLFTLCGNMHTYILFIYLIYLYSHPSHENVILSSAQTTTISKQSRIIRIKKQNQNFGRTVTGIIQFTLCEIFEVDGEAVPEVT